MIFGRALLIASTIASVDAWPLRVTVSSTPRVRAGGAMQGRGRRVVEVRPRVRRPLCVGRGGAAAQRERGRGRLVGVGGQEGKAPGGEVGERGRGVGQDQDGRNQGGAGRT